MAKSCCQTGFISQLDLKDYTQWIAQTNFFQRAVADHIWV